MRRWHFQPRQLQAIYCVLILTTIGCGENRLPTSTLATAQLAFDEAVVAIEAGDYTTARIKLDDALTNSGGLTPDCYADALLSRSICLSMAGELEGAAADIETASQGTYDMVKFHIARGVLFSKQGDTAAATQEFEAVQSIDPKVKIPST